MQIQIRLFAGLREKAGADQVTLQLPEGSKVSDALVQLAWLTAGTKVVMAVNREYATEDQRLAANDELALIPPVSGGAPAGAPPGQAVHVHVSAQPLSPDAVAERVRDPHAGAIVTFQGVTREVPALEYEAYIEMAQIKLREIVAAALAHHDLCRAAAEHRIGTVALSEPSVVVAASAPHREQAFAGAREIIDQIKAQAPIWKREEGSWLGSEVPVASTRPGANLM